MQAIQRRVYPPKAALIPLASIAIISIASFMIRNPKPVGIFLRMLGAGAAIGYCCIEDKRRRIESGEEALDQVALAMEALNIQAADLERRKAEAEAELESLMGAIDEELQAKLAEIEGEWNTIESQRQELTQIGAELSARRAALEFEQETWEKDSVLRVKKMELELYDRRHEVEVREHNIEVRESEFKTMSRTAALKEQVLMEQQKEAMLADHHSRLEEIQHERDKAIVDREVLEEQFLQKSYELEAAKSEAVNELEIAQAKLGEMVAEREEYLVTVQEQLAIDYENSIVAHINEHQEYIEGLELTIAQLTDQIDQRDALKGFEPHHGYAGIIGDKILAAIRSFEIQIHPHECRNLPWGTQTRPAIVVWLKLGHRAKIEDIARIKTNIESAVGIHPMALTMDRHGFVVFAIGDVRGAVELPEQPAESDGKGGKITQVIEAKITEPSPRMIEAAMGRSLMYLIAGDPGSGKSTFVVNLVSFSSAFFGKDEIDYYINDLKYPDPDTLWKIRGKDVIPQYCLLQESPGLSRFGLCIDGVQDMYAFFLARKTKRLEDVANNREIRRFKKAMWIIDECPALTDAYKADATVCIKNTIRVGRALEGKVVLIGQSHLCSDYGLRTSDLKNMSRFYLGADYAMLALQGGKTAQITVSPERRKQLTTEIHARQKLASEQIERGELLPNGQPAAKYFALVAAAGEAFLMTLPPPGAFEAMEAVESEDDAYPVIPDEEVQPIVQGVRLTVYEQIERAKIEDGLLNSDNGDLSDHQTIATSTPGFNPSQMSPLQRSIVEFCQRHLRQQFTPSAIYSGSRDVQKSIESIHNRQKPNDRQRPSALVEEACRVLVNDWGVGAIVQGSKGSVKFGIDR